MPAGIVVQGRPEELVDQANDALLTLPSAEEHVRYTDSLHSDWWR
jgi:hypothetical protein